MMVSVAQCFLLGIEAPLARIPLSVFTVPIIARMSGLPLDKLIIAHNIACSATLFCTCLYVLYNVPDLIHSVHQGFKQLRSVLMIRGIGFGFVVLCRRLRLKSLMSTFFLLMFSLRFYAEFTLNSSAWGTTVAISAIASAIRSPFSLLGLGLTVGYASQFVVFATRWILGAEQAQENNTQSSGFIESLTLVFICVQAGILGMSAEQKVLMLRLVLFVVLSALLQSLCDVLSVHALVLSANPMASTYQHVKCLAFCAILFLLPISIVSTLMTLIPMNLWLVLILSNCSMISLRVLQTAVIFFVTLMEERSNEPWDSFDDIAFWCRLVIVAAEWLLSVLVVVYGTYASLIQGVWSVLSVVVLLFHTYFNVIRRSEDGVALIRARREALYKISSLRPADSAFLRELNDNCVICCSGMRSNALITNCGHVFHAFCLKKWSTIKAVCPLCYKDLNEPNASDYPQKPSQRPDDAAAPSTQATHAEN